MPRALTRAAARGRRATRQRSWHPAPEGSLRQSVTRVLAVTRAAQHPDRLLLARPHGHRILPLRDDDAVRDPPADAGPSFEPVDVPPAEDVAVVGRLAVG